jgi:hypothetical protein
MVAGKLRTPFITAPEYAMFVSAALLRSDGKNPIKEETWIPSRS